MSSTVIECGALSVYNVKMKQVTDDKWEEVRLTYSELKAKVTMKLIMSCPLDVGLLDIIADPLSVSALALVRPVYCSLYGCHMPHDLWNGMTLLTLLTIGGQSQWRSCG